jgi:hypothetical protein
MVKEGADGTRAWSGADGAFGLRERRSGRSRYSGNSRNGTSSKTVLTEDGEIEISVPRDRAGSFEPQLISIVVIGEGVVWYSGQFWALNFLQQVSKVDPVTSAYIVGAGVRDRAAPILIWLMLGCELFG